MSDNPPTHALVDVACPRRFVDVSDVVQDPSVNYRAEDLKVGQSVSVTYLGEVHTVYVVPATSNYRTPAAQRRGFGRYIYRGRRYRTLSAVAYRITGDRFFSGNRFFRLMTVHNRRERRRQRGTED